MSLHAQLTTLLGHVADDKFFLHALPQEYDLPCVVFRVLSDEPVPTLCGPESERLYQAGFECIAETFEEADAIATEVRGLLEADSTLPKWEIETAGEEYEPLTDDFTQPVFYGFHT